MTDYKWQPIEPLTERDRAIDLAASRPLYDSWQASKQRLLKSSEASLKSFTERLVRRLSIETGILERLYDLDRGTTEALVVKGFVEDLVSRSSTDIEPSRLIDILRDQEAAVQLVMDCVAGNRHLTKGVIHELHVILTRHQDTVMAVDQFGTRREIPLLRGRFKELPNNPRRPDRSIHEYCPPSLRGSSLSRIRRIDSMYPRTFFCAPWSLSCLPTRPQSSKSRIPSLDGWTQRSRSRLRSTATSCRQPEVSLPPNNGLHPSAGEGGRGSSRALDNL